MALIDTKIALPSTGGGVNKNGTPVITGTNGYGDYFTITGVNNTPTTPISVGNTSPVLVGGNTGNIYGDVLTPTLAPELTEPVYSPIIGSGSVGGNLLKPVDPSQYFDGSVVGTVGGGFSSGNSGGVTDEGVITGRLPNADDATFNNNGFTGTGTPQITPTNGVSGGTSSNSGTATGTGAGASTNTGAGTGDSTPTTPTDTEEKTTMSYEEYIAEQKAREEEKRQAALKEAEIYKERAAADAQASYMQNMSTYGVNAENMAQMGLTGGGYSDYLNAQAYAQKRGEMQTASANELALKQQAETKYADNILSLDGQLLAYQEAEKAEKEQYAKSVYNTLWEAVQDPNTTYTADSIKAIAEKAGLSDEDISTLTGMLDATQAKKVEDETKAEEEQAAAKEEEKATYSAGLKSEAMATIEANGGMSVEYINSLKGYGMSDADIAEVVEYNNKYIFNASVSTLNTAKANGDIATMESILTQADNYYKDGQMTAERYQELYSIYSTYSVDTVMGMDYGSDYKKKLNTILDQKSEIEEQYKAGKISKATYDTLMGKINAQTSNTAKGGWYIQGLGTGRNNDDVDITIGGTSRNKDTEYDLLCGDAIKDSNLVAELNRIATGDPTKSPSTKNEDWTGCKDVNSNSKAGKLIVAYGNMYLYTTKGWVPLKNDNNDYDLGNAIRAFLGS